MIGSGISKEFAAGCCNFTDRIFGVDRFEPFIGNSDGAHRTEIDLDAFFVYTDFLESSEDALTREWAAFIRAVAISELDCFGRDLIRCSSLNDQVDRMKNHPESSKFLRELFAKDDDSLPINAAQAINYRYYNSINSPFFFGMPIRVGVPGLESLYSDYLQFNVSEYDRGKQAYENSLDIVRGSSEQHLHYYGLPYYGYCMTTPAMYCMLPVRMFSHYDRRNTIGRTYDSDDPVINPHAITYTMSDIATTSGIAWRACIRFAPPSLSGSLDDRVNYCQPKTMEHIRNFFERLHVVRHLNIIEQYGGRVTIRSTCSDFEIGVFNPKQRTSSSHLVINREKGLVVDVHFRFSHDNESPAIPGYLHGEFGNSLNFYLSELIRWLLNDAIAYCFDCYVREEVGLTPYPALAHGDNPKGNSRWRSD